MNTYPDSVRFLYALGNEIKAAKFGLETIGKVLVELGHPEKSCRFVHVAGTNGKGSTCAMIESGLRAAGVCTGLYTSPHLVEPVERIQIAGEPVTHEEFAGAFDLVHQASEKLVQQGALEHHPTYFETVTAMAMVLFRAKEAEVAVLEVGLGGRLDATNIVTPELCVITPVDFDHETFLGHTIEAIAAEKAGILKPRVPVVLARQRPEAERVILARARDLACPVVQTGGYAPLKAALSAHGSRIEWPDLDVRCPLAGAHQVENTTAAVLALRQLKVPRRAIEDGIASAHWPGRLEPVAAHPEIILDGAHNPAGARVLADHIRSFYSGRKVWLIYGTMRDKSIGEIAETLFPLAAELVLTAPKAPRALDPRSLLALCEHRSARVAIDLVGALDLVRSEAGPDDAVFISGSLFLVGEARALLVK